MLKKQLAAILIFTVLSANAQDVVGRKPVKVKASQLSEAEARPSMIENLKTVSNCEQGYYYTREHLSRFDIGMEYVMASSLAGPFFGVFIGGLFFGAAGVGAAIPLVALATVEASAFIMPIPYTRAEKIFIASRLCVLDIDCNYKPLNKLNRWLERKGIQLSNEELAAFINEKNTDIGFCTERINRKGMHKLKTYNELRISILESLSRDIE